MKRYISTINQTEATGDRRFYSLSIENRTTLCQNLGLQIVDPPTLPKADDTVQPCLVHPTKGDGNCFFRAVAFILTGSESSHSALRDAVIKEMTDNCKEKLEHYLNKNMAGYLNESGMVKDSVWATDAEIFGTASLLQADIAVFTKYGTAYRWLRYPASFESCSTSEQCLLLRHCADHFEPVLKCMKQIL